MSNAMQPQDETTRYFLLKVTSAAEMNLEQPSFSQYDIRPLDVMVSLNFIVTDNESEADIRIEVQEFSGEDIGEFLDDFVDPSELLNVGARQFSATLQSYNKDGMALGDGDGDGDAGGDSDDESDDGLEFGLVEDEDNLSNVEDDFDFLDEDADDPEPA